MKSFINYIKTLIQKLLLLQVLGSHQLVNTTKDKMKHSIIFNSQEDWNFGLLEPKIFQFLKEEIFRLSCVQLYQQFYTEWRISQN
jgi:hypothetical protein